MLAILSFIFFTGLVGLCTYLMTRGEDTETSVGYFLAGRSLTGGYVAGSLLLTNLSTEQLVGLNGTAFSDGLVVMAWEVIAAISLVALGLFFLPRYLAKGVTTVPQYLAGRFSDTTRVLCNLIFILAYTVLLLPIILYTGAIGLIDILSLQELTPYSRTTLLWGAVWLTGILGSIYAIFGGLRSIAVSDTLNGFGLLIGGVLIAYLGLQLVGGGNPLEGLTVLKENHPEKFSSLGDNNSSVPWHTLFSGVLLLNMFYWNTNQQIIQRAFAAKSLAEGQRGVMIAAFFKILAPLILVLPGIMAFHLDSKGELFTERQLSAFQGQVDVAFTKALAANPELLTDANITEAEWKTDKLLANKKDKAYGSLVSHVLPWWLRGFFAAVIVGAVLSSYNSVLNSIVTLFCVDAYQRFIRPQATELQTVGVGRVLGTVVALASMSLAPLLAGQDSIFVYLQKMNGLYAAPIFAVVLVGMFTRLVPAFAANTALIAGVLIIGWVYFAPAGLAGPLATMNGFHFIGLVFAALVFFMLLMGELAPRSIDPATEVADGERPDGDYVPMEPWPYAKPVAAFFIIWVVSIYVYFAI